MKPKLCIVGQTHIINIGRKAASKFSDKADFIFIISPLEESWTFLRAIEGVVDIFLAGHSTTRPNSTYLKIPIVSFCTTLPDLIQAILKAHVFDNRIALVLSSNDDSDIDLSLLSKAMNVSLSPFYYGSHEETDDASKRAKKEHYMVIIGGNFTVQVAEELGLKGIWLYEGMDMIRATIKSAIQICRFQHDEIRRRSQLAALINHFSEGLILADGEGQIVLDTHSHRLFWGYLNFTA
jgi:propionate catabolism operon transcriptional regulator